MSNYSHDADAASPIISSSDRLAPLTVRPSEACRLVGIGRTQLYSLIAKKRLPILKLGRSTLIRVDDLRRLIAEAA